MFHIKHVANAWWVIPHPVSSSYLDDNLYSIFHVEPPITAYHQRASISPPAVDRGQDTLYKVGCVPPWLEHRDVLSEAAGAGLLALTRGSGFDLNIEGLGWHFGCKEMQLGESVKRQFWRSQLFVFTAQVPSHTDMHCFTTWHALLVLQQRAHAKSYWVNCPTNAEYVCNQTEASRVLGPKFQPRIHKLPSRVFKQMWIYAVQGGEINTPYFKWFLEHL